MRGIHWSASTNHASPISRWDYWRNELAEMGITHVKLLDDNGSSMKMCDLLIAAGITPIVRMYRPRPNPGVFTQWAALKDLVSIGVRYFETNNEPNLRSEWIDSSWAQPWRDRIATVMDNWIYDAQELLSHGALPAFPALAQCGHSGGPDYVGDAIGSIPFYDEAFRWLAADNKAYARQLFMSGAWLAVHDATLNHCYQDYNGDWHFEYPYDPICQATEPGKTVLQDDNSLIGHRAALEILQQHLGLDITPQIISTEGGVFMPKGGFAQWDSRYPGYDYNGQAARTVAMYAWLAHYEPGVVMCPWLIANEAMGHNDTSWTNDVWYPQDGERPVVAAMKASVPQPPVTEAQIREAAWNKTGKPYNAAAAFQRYATMWSLGVPMTDEFDVGDCRVQGFAGCIIYCVLGDWGNIKEVDW